MNPRVVEGVSLVLIGLLALGLYLGLSLSLVRPFEPLSSSILPENPSYVALMYNVTALSYPTNQSAWALLLVKFNETSELASSGLLTMLTYVTRVGGSPTLASSLESLTQPPAEVPEGGQPFIAYADELSALPHSVIFLKGSPYSVAVLEENLTGPAGLFGREVAYYSLSTGVLLWASLDYYYANGTPYTSVNYTLYNVTALAQRSGSLVIVRTGLVMLSLGVLAGVAGVGLVVGVQRILSSAG
ncbi:MAG: hypothetical protein ACP5HK_06400 [Acidilobus sp.]